MTSSAYLFETLHVPVRLFMTRLMFHVEGFTSSFAPLPQVPREVPGASSQ
jgi:hypothetical protein